MKMEYQLLHTNTKYVRTCNLHEGVYSQLPVPVLRGDMMKMEYQPLHFKYYLCITDATYMKAYIPSSPSPYYMWVMKI